MSTSEKEVSSKQKATICDAFIDKYHGLRNYMERETISTGALIYGVSGIMLLVAYKKRRPAYLVRQFKKPSHIPDKIVDERIIHTGIVRDIQQRGKQTLLLVNHRPWFSLFARRDRVLPVALPGVQVNMNGYSWLQSCLVGREATFLPLPKGKMNDFVVCQMCLLHPLDKKPPSRLLDISEVLLKLGFAKFNRDSATDVKSNSKYYKYLQAVENNTQSKTAWVNFLSRYPWLWNSLHDLRAKILPKQKLLPELVRS